MSGAPEAYPPGVQLTNLHTPVWWGGMLALLGLFYVVKFRPGRAASRCWPGVGDRGQFCKGAQGRPGASAVETELSRSSEVATSNDPGRNNEAAER